MPGPPDVQTVLSLDFDPASLPTTRASSPQPPAPTHGDGNDIAESQVVDAISVADDTASGRDTPPLRAQAAPPASVNFTPMRKGKIHGLEDSPTNRQTVSDRKTRAQEEMAAKGRAVDALRAERLKLSAQRKQVAGGDAVHSSGIPVWGGGATGYSKAKTAFWPPDPFARARAESESARAASATTAAKRAATAGTGGPKPLVMAPRPSSVMHGKQRASLRSGSPPPTAGPSSLRYQAVPQSTRSEPWRPFTQYLPHQRRDSDGSDGGPAPRAQAPSVDVRGRGHAQASTGKGKGKAPAATQRSPTPDTDREEALEREYAAADAADMERLNEEAARHIQERLWAEEREYNRAHRSASHASVDDPMDEDVFGDEDDDVEVIASDSEHGGAQADGYDSFDDISDPDGPDDKDEEAALINIEPALGDDRAKAAARASIFADTKARIRWSPPTYEPIAGMTQAKMVSGIDPAQLEQHIRSAYCLEDVYIGVVHAVGGTRAAELDRVTLITALDAMISLTCRTGTKVLFSAARQDQNGPSLRPGTVLIDTHDEDLGALWQESAHWAMAGVRITIQKYHQPNSAFMVTLEGTRRNAQSVAHGVRNAARKLTPLKNVFRQYNLIHPGLGKAARDNLIRSVVARPMTLTSRKALGFGTVQYNIYARLHERAQDIEPRVLTGDENVDGFPPLSAEMHWAVRDAFRQVAIIDGRLGDATPIDVPWDCNLCFAEEHPAGKCHLKEVEGWFKSYDEFLAANAPPDRADKPKADVKGKAKAAPTRGGRGGSRGRGGSARGGSTRGAPPRRAGAA